MAGRKYQFMESNQQRRAAGLKDKMPDIQKTLDTVKFLKTRTVCNYTSTLIYRGSDIIPSLVPTPSKPLSSSTILCRLKQRSPQRTKSICGLECVILLDFQDGRYADGRIGKCDAVISNRRS